MESSLATVAPLTVVTVAAVLSRSSSLSCALAAAAAAAATACLRIRLLVDVTCLGSGCRFGGGFGASRFRPALQRDDTRYHFNDVGLGSRRERRSRKSLHSALLRKKSNYRLQEIQLLPGRK